MRKLYQSPGQDEKLILLYCPGRGLTHDLPHTVASNMVNGSHALNHSATEAVVGLYDCFYECFASHITRPPSKYDVRLNNTA